MDSSYAPQSPDLSSFLSSPSKQQQHAYQSTSQSTSYAPRSPVIPAFNNTQPPYQHHNHNRYAPSGQQQHGPQASLIGVGVNKDVGEYGSTAAYMPPIPDLPPSHSSFGAARTSSSPYFLHNNPPRIIKDEDAYEYKPQFDGSDDTIYLSSPQMPSHGPRASRGQAASSMSSSSHFPSTAPPPQLQQNYKNPNPNNIEIKTKFPVARIKRIMQADEEVGKVAQVTPVAVSKALELFMIALVSGAAEKAKAKGGKRVTAQHLKMVVQGDEQFDFLNEIVGKVADVQEGAGGNKRKEKAEGSESEEEKKVKKGKGRRKKSDE